MKRKIGVIAAAFVYVLLLLMLVRAESSCAQSGIQSFSDALWYSLVTITTVGYGDLYPVSPAGKAIGIFFLMLSAGFLAFVIGLVYQMLSGRIWPLLLLYANRKKKIFLFSDVNRACSALSENLAEKQPDALQIFCRAGKLSDTPGAVRRSGRIFVREDVADMLAHAVKMKAECSVFLMSDNELLNSDKAYALCGQGAQVYCCAEESGRLDQISYFQPAACCARHYWEKFPMHEAERCVVLVGEKGCAQAMLSHAIVTNCRTPFSSVEYHLFGDWDEYRRVHYSLSQVLTINEQEAGKDALFFHPHAWNDDPALLARADRIIFCGEDEGENARLSQVLARSYAHDAAVYVRTEHSSAQGILFGGVRELYTVELVMKTRQDLCARQMHEQYRRNAGKAIPEWEKLDAFLRESNRAVADHVPTKLSMLLGESAQMNAENCRRAAEKYREMDESQLALFRQNEHDRWMRFYSLHNWRLGTCKDAKKRCHPCMVPYAQLSEPEQKKDDYAWMQLELLAADAETQEKL